MNATDRTRSDHRERVVRVLRAIQRGVAADDRDALAPERLAGLAHYSRFHFTRLFTAMVGESLREHVRRIRLERAAGDLVRTDETVIRIAMRCGYNAHAPFTRAFRAHFGATPSAFRKSAEEPLTFPRCANGVHFGVDDSVSRFVPLLKENPMMDVSIQQHPRRRTAALTHTGPYQQIGPVFERLGALAGPAGLLGPGCEMIGVYVDDPEHTPADELTSYACCAVADGAPIPDGLDEREIAGGACAVALYVGSYERLEEAYNWFYGTWLPASGHEPADSPCFEIYRSDPKTTPVDEQVVEICIPLQA